MLGSKQLGLSLQPRTPDPGAVSARIVHADLSGEEFRLAWRKIPMWLRGVSYLVAPAFGLWMRAFGTREALAKRLTLEDQPSQTELLNWNPETAAIDAALLDARDARLIERLDALLDEPSPEFKRIAIVYGAAHVRAVLKAITGRRGFFAENCEWLTVFSL
jgi:hypothetical protein